MNYTTSHQKGYAILFAVIVISIILTISLGLSNIAYKQLIVSSVARDSELAFYESDTATDCALYADFSLGTFSTATPQPIHCGVDKTGADYVLDVSYSTDGTTDTYQATPHDSSWNTSINPCFTMTVLKTAAKTVVKGKGYNICNKANARTVEREIDITYQ